MKYLACLSLILTQYFAQGQFIPSNLKLDFSAGNHFNHTQLADGYHIKTIALHNLMGGMTYMLKSNLSLRSEFAVDMNRPTSESLYLKNDYFRATIGVSSDLLDIRLKRTEGFKNAARLWQDKFKLIGFFGIGVSTMVNKVKFDEDYGNKIFLYDYMYNVTGSITPTYYLNRYTSVFLRVSMIGHIRQAYTFDLMDYNPNPFFDGAFMTCGAGLAFTPFKSVVGAHAIN